ncbi:MAG: hypothetical protein IT304_00545 [Dehalococcoidia bacterium]|nr:hypothetical protein [Dehalococcoidia bacterium]
MIGTLVAIEATTVTVQRSGASELAAIPRGEVTRFEISTKESRKERGAGFGALVRLGVVAAVGFATGYRNCELPDAPDFMCFNRPLAAIVLGVPGAGLGAVLGLIFAPREKWEKSDPKDLQSSVIPSPGGNGVQGNSDSGYAAISADGRWVAFKSNASNLVAGGTYGVPDVFVHDRVRYDDDGERGTWGSPHAFTTRPCELAERSSVARIAARSASAVAGGRGPD